MNHKLVCRSLYFAIEENIQFLDRPRVTCLRICYAENKLIGVDFDLKFTENILRGRTIKHAEFCNDCEYKDFWKNKDFTGMRQLVKA